jgi:hypothetical protein
MAQHLRIAEEQIQTMLLAQEKLRETGMTVPGLIP